MNSTQRALAFLLTIIAIFAVAAAAIATPYPEVRQPLPWEINPTKGTLTNPIVVKIVMVGFPNTDDVEENYYDEEIVSNVTTNLSALIEEQSNGMVNIIFDNVEVPDDVDAIWQATENSGVYGNIGTVPRVWANCWGTDDYGYWGELESEILNTIQSTYNLRYGSGNWVSPLADSDWVLFIYRPNHLGGDEFGNPMIDGAAAYSELRLYDDAACTGLEDILDGAPIVNGFLLGLQCNWVSYENHADWITHIIMHEMGHKFGFDHPVESLEEPGSERCLFGSYNLMRAEAIPDYINYEYGYYLPWDRVRNGWVTVEEVTESLHSVTLADFHESQTLYLVPIKREGTHYDNEYDCLDHWEYRTEAFVIAYHDGLGSHYGPVDKGLYVWHTIVAETVYDNTCYSWEAGESIWSRWHVTDLEVATGLFTDPGVWQNPNPTSANARDSLDDWQGRVGYEAYLGSGTDADLFNFGAEAEFSYKTNPNTNGYDWDLEDIPYQGYLSKFALAQTEENSISIRIVGTDENSIVVDLLLAPNEDVIAPNSEGIFGIGDLVDIEWTTNYTTGQTSGIIDVVDILYSTDGGESYPNDVAHVIAEGVNANLGTYTWTPTATQISDRGKIKIVSHNIRTDYTGEDESDGVFSVVAARFANKSQFVDIDYDGAPYCATTFDYNEDGQNDLFVSIKQTYVSRMFELDYVNGYGVPVFDDRSQFAFGQGERPTAAMGGIATADFDNDGYLDILVTGGNGGVLRLYHQKPNAPGDFEDWSEEMELDAFGEDSWAGAWGDYDRDGQIDLYLCRGDANGSDPGSGMGNVANVLLKNDYADSGEFIDLTSHEGLGGYSSTASVTATWMDVDADGDLDLLRGDAKSMLNGTGSRLYINQGSGPFVDEIADLIPGGAGALDCISGIKWLDANNDGAVDLAVSRNTVGKSPKVFLNEGDGQFDAASSLALASSTTGLEAWDYDLDGRQDVLCLPEGSSAAPALFGNRLVDSAIEFHDHTSDVGLNASTGRVDGSVVCDYNRDGDQDLYFGRPVAGNNFYYQAQADANSDEPIYNWVGAYLTQRVSTNPTPAIGARVTFHGSENFQQVQVVDGGSGRGSQNDLVLTCGVGEDEGPITCDIVWPSGRVETGRQLTLGAYTTLAEPTGFTLYDNTVTATYQVYPVGLDSRMDWTFTWETNYLTDPARDRVLIDAPSQGCSLNDYELSASDAAVDWNVTPVANGHYRHTMKWSNLPCVQGCTYTYTVRSERDVTSHESDTHSLVIRLCSSGN